MQQKDFDIRDERALWILSIAGLLLLLTSGCVEVMSDADLKGLGNDTALDNVLIIAEHLDDAESSHLLETVEAIEDTHVLSE